MVGYDPAKRTLTYTGYGCAGAASGVITRLLCQPLDVLKIRFQLQVEPIQNKSTSTYSGILQATAKIFQDEHMSAFWKGHMPAQILSMVYGTVQFAAFELLTRYVWYVLPCDQRENFKPVAHFSCGCVAGGIATLAAQPFDVIRTRFIAQGNTKTYKSIWGATSTILCTEGVMGLYRGLIPTLIQIIPQAGFQFGFYTFFQNRSLLITNKTMESQGFIVSFVSGACAGACSKAAIFPLDMVKKRLQAQGFEHGRVGFGKNPYYQGFIHCVRTVVQEEGTRGLYKGLCPSMYKAIISTGLHFSLYDYICRLLISHRQVT